MSARANVRKLYAVRFIYWMHTIAAVLVPFLRDWGGIPLAQIFLLNAWFMAWNFLLEVPTGTVADRFGRKVSLCLGCAMGGIGTLTYCAAPRIEVFLVAEILFAISLTLMSGADEALLYDTLDGAGEAESAPQRFARLESWKLGGIVVGALTGSAIVGALGLRATVAAQALPMLVAAAIAATIEEPAAHHASGVRPGYLATLRDGLRHFADDPALRPLALDAAGIGALCFLIIWLYQPLLEAGGIGLAAFGSVHVGMCLGQIAVLGNLGRLHAAFGSRRGLLTGMTVAAGTGFVGLGLVRGPAWAVVALVVLAASFGLARTPVLTSALNLHIPSAHRATVLSVVSGLRTLAIVAGNGAASLAVGRSLHGAVLGFGAAILVLALLSRVREHHLGGSSA